MAYIPKGASLIPADDGTFPIVRMENVYILPGVPRLFQKNARGDRLAVLRRPLLYRIGNIFGSGVMALPNTRVHPEGAP